MRKATCGEGQEGFVVGYGQITYINGEWEEQKSPTWVGIEERVEPMSKLVN